MTFAGGAVSVSTVHVLAIPVRHHCLSKLRPADASHFIRKNTREQHEVFRIFEIRQGRKHPQVRNFSRRDAVLERSKSDREIRVHDRSDHGVSACPVSVVQEPSRFRRHGDDAAGIGGGQAGRKII